VLAIIIILIGGWYVYKGNTSFQGAATTTTEARAATTAPAMDAAMTASHDMVGTWQSTEDSKSVRVFNTDHTVTDVYEGETLSSGQCTTFTKATAPTVSYPLEDGKVYMQIVDNGETHETYDYIVSNINATDLQLIYLGRGGALNYKRVK